MFGLKPICTSGLRTGLTSGSVQRRIMMTGRLNGFRSALFRMKRASISAMTSRMMPAIAYQTTRLRMAKMCIR